MSKNADAANYQLGIADSEPNYEFPESFKVKPNQQNQKP